MLASFWNSAATRGVGAGAVCLLVVAGCTDPVIDRPGTWHATGVNDQNLQAMLADPRDTSVGTGALTTRGETASRAVTRLLTDRRRQLLDVTVSKVGPTSSPTDAPLAAGAGASGTGQ